MQSGPKPIVVVGSINIDLVANAEKIPVAGETVRGSDFQVHPGGRGANQAVAVARLGYPVQLIGKVGTDAFGEQLLSYLQQAGVGVAAMEKHEGPSGVAMIAVSSRGENSIVVTPGANAQVTPGFLDAHRQTIRSAGIVLAQLEIPIETVEHLANLCEQEKVPLMLDPAPAHTLPETIFHHQRWLTPNETEAAFFAAQFSEDAGESEPPHIADTLLHAGVNGVVLKMGSRGVSLSSSSSSSHVIPAFSVKPSIRQQRGTHLTERLPRRSCWVWSRWKLRGLQWLPPPFPSRVPAQPSMPSRAEVDELLGAHQ